MRPIDADAIPKEFLEYEFDGKWNGCTIKDLIDEQPTIQPKQTDEQVIDYCKKKGYKIVADDLFNLLSKPEPQWIPVSERLPETEEFVLASLTGKYRNTTFEHACEIADYADGEWCVYAYPHMSAEKCEELIEAWMPLPEPYKPNK